MFQKLLCVALLFAVTALRADAATLVTFNFTNGSLAPTAPTPSAGVSATDVTGFSGAVSSNYAYSNQTAVAFNNNTSTGRYGQFTITASNVGDLLDLTSISFNYDIYQSAVTADIPITGSLDLYYSLNNWSNQNLIQSFSDTSSKTYTANPTGSISLTGIADIPSISFRIYQNNSANVSSSNYRFIFDNLNLTGDVVAVPEPSSCVLLFGAVVLCVVRFRRAPAIFAKVI